MTEQMSLFQVAQPQNPLTLCQIDRNVSDGLARFQAIHPGESFIVQAPAGSGKTALLTQRFLALLSQVTQPEQIVAMTFTKKAAAEMRERLFKSLAAGASPLAETATIFEQNTHVLAQAALNRNAQMGWQLLQNPNRLRIRTLDSMNGYLVQQMPLLSRLGTQAQVSQVNDDLYRLAVRETLKDTQLSEAVGELLRLMNGRYAKAENLLVAMLKKRDQWMKHLGGVNSDAGREYLEASLAILVQGEAKQAKKQLSGVMDIFNEMVGLAEYAVDHDYPPAQALLGVRFGLDLDDLLPWRVLGNWLLTQKDTLRSRITKNEGFPGGKGHDKAIKEQFVDCLQGLNERHAEALAILRALPEPHYADEQWQTLSHLVVLLNHAVAYLKWVFQQQGQADFIEIAQAANLALGSEEAPTDLAQQLDYQIQHLLIDEFQDTSVEQFDLLKKLTAGWGHNDGHTLFIVGDPMQSIYRFREAEVGNFLQAWSGSLGQGQLRLTPLNLTENFRSKAGVVDWVNASFKKVLPVENNIQLGAVRYTSATVKPTKAGDVTGEVRGLWALNQTPAEEVASLVGQLQATLATKKTGETIGVLGRSRSHLMPLALALKAENIAFRAVELEALAERQEIQDVVALTRALLHLGDRPAWIALLRSPLFGLSLEQLYELLGQNEDYFATPVWQSLQTNGLVHSGLAVISWGLQHLGDMPLAQLVREVWLGLHGPQTLPAAEAENALLNVDAYWQLLESLSASNLAGKALDYQQLEAALADLYALPDASPESAEIELMTMHKSKGLEFDYVFLPGLGRAPKGDTTSLVSWLRFADVAGDERLILAPIQQRGQDSPALIQLIRKFEAQKQTYEMGRLLYVAVTRAKQVCYLLGSVRYQDKADAEGNVKLVPANQSLLSSLWPVVESEFRALIDDYEFNDVSLESTSLVAKVSRLPKNHPSLQDCMSTFVLPDLVKVVSQETRETSDELSKTGDVSALLNTSVGILVHQVLELLTKPTIDLPENTPENCQAWLTSRLPAYQHWLRGQGLQGEQLEQALARVMDSLQNALSHKQVRWALAGPHLEAVSEWALSSRFELEQPQENHIIDRSFVDVDGQRWIVDYKTGQLPEGKAQDEFVLEQVEKYRPQLQRYGQLLAQLEQRPQRWVLYFSALNLWHEIPSQ